MTLISVYPQYSLNDFHTGMQVVTGRGQGETGRVYAINESNGGKVSVYVSGGSVDCNPSGLVMIGDVKSYAAEPDRAKKLAEIAALSARIRNAIELSCITNGDFPTEVMDAECDSICRAITPEMAELIRDALSGYVEVCKLLGLPDPY